MNGKTRFLIESLYCNCGKTSDSKSFNEYLALKSFANSIGGEVYTSDRNLIISKLLSEYTDFLPYGKYQLRFKGVAQLFLERLFQGTISPLSDVTSKVKHHCRPTAISPEYFVCKRCCPICALSQRGCPLHCCTECWKNLATMSHININKIPMTRIGKLSKKRKGELTDQLNSVIKHNPDYTTKLKNRSVGYLHGTYDIIEFLYISYEYDVDTIKPMIEALTRSN
jgi:hypothetical protein